MIMNHKLKLLPALSLEMVRYVAGLGISNPTREDVVKGLLSWVGHNFSSDFPAGFLDINHLGGGTAAYYPETSGYWINTFLALARMAGRASSAFAGEHRCMDFGESAAKTAETLINIQAPSGGMPSRINSTTVRVFNTAQVLLGWTDLCRYHRESDGPEDARLHSAINKATDFLINSQENDGSWRGDVTYAGARTYHARVAWSLYEAAEVVNRHDAKSAADLSLRWVLGRYTGRGFARMGFTSGEANTHCIGYLMRGLTESLRFVEGELRGLLLETLAQFYAKFYCESKRYLRDNRGKLLAGYWDEKALTPIKSASCLTGNYQIAIALYTAHSYLPGMDLKALADSLVDGSNRTQIRASAPKAIANGIYGSYPPWGRYVRLGVPNWAVKFALDANLISLYPGDYEIRG